MKAVILGAGVGGLSTAIALRLEGFDCEIYERAAAISDMGAGIVCWPNASFVLDQLSLLDEVKNIAGNPTSMCRLTHTGEDLGTLNIATLNKTMGYNSYSIFRKDLMNILYTHVMRLNIKIHFRHTVDVLRLNSDDSSDIQFQSGKIINADMVIASDGRMNSVARKFVNGNNRPKYQGFINWVGKIETTSDIINSTSIKDYWGIGQRFGLVPISSNAAYWAAAIAAPEIVTTDLATKPATGSTRRSITKSTNTKNELLSIFAHWSSPISSIIRETLSQNIHKIYVHDHDPISVWHRKNVLIIGDAAHAPLPTSGQGACQALEDAWHLATLLSKKYTGDNIGAIFQEFTDIRFKKTSQITLGARNFAKSLFNLDPQYCAERNDVSRSTDYNDMVSGMSKSWGEGLPLTA